ncbi:MAG: biotin--[acetyl-CoA-carboxylase] ligase, partial [Microbacterium sp.]
MPMREEGYPRAAATSPLLQVRERTGSTNADLVAAVARDPGAWPHLSVLLTTDQTAGRGRLDRSWTAPRGSALAASVLVRVPAIPPAARGWIPLVAGLAMARAIAAQLTGHGHTVRAKWPNDVLVEPAAVPGRAVGGGPPGGGKICGILAEAVPGDTDAVVIGAGVNTRMAAVDLPVPTAISFAALGAQCDDDALLADYLTTLDEQLSALAAAGGDAAAAGVAAAVEAVCATLGQQVAVALP